MSRAIKATTVAISAIVLLTTMAWATLPTAGSTYKGPAMDKGHVYGHVKLVAETTHKLSLVQMKDYCGTVHKFHNVKVADDGTFEAIKKNSAGTKVFDIKGQFTSKSKSKGSTSQRGCDNALTTFVAKKQ